MTTYTGAANYLDGIPVVPTTAARAARFPSPPNNFRVHNLETGAVQRYVAATASWTTDFLAVGVSVSGVVNVRDPAFGAAGDGTTNDSAAFVAANTAAAATGATIFVPPGTYKLVTAPTFSANVRVVGAGKDTAILKAGTAAMATVVTASADTWFDGLQFLGLGTTNGGERGIDTAAARVRVTACRFTSLTNGIRFSGTAATDGAVTLCDFITIVGLAGVSEGYGVLSSGLRLRVVNNWFKTVERHAIYFGSTCCDSLADGNTIDGVASSHAIQVYGTAAQSGCHRNRITNNRITAVTNAVGIIVSDHGTDNVVAGNVIDGLTGAAGYGILVTSGASTPDVTNRVQRTRVQGNSVTNSGATADGIAVLNADDTLVQGNTLVGNATGYGIHAYTSGSGGATNARTRVDGNTVAGYANPIRFNGASVTGAVLGRNFFGTNTSNLVLNTSTSLVADQVPNVGADRGNAATTLTMLDEPTVVYATAITADRAVTLPAANAFPGARFRVLRKASCTGAFNVNVGTGPLKALGTAGSFCDVEYDGSAWVLTGYGVL